MSRTQSEYLPKLQSYRCVLDRVKLAGLRFELCRLLLVFVRGRWNGQGVR